MMRAFFNLFLSLGMPVTVLFISLATGYFMMDYDLSKALKLGTLSGFIAAVVFSLLMAAVLLLMRKVRSARTAKRNPERTIIHESENGPLDKTFILLMDKVIAFEVLVHSVIDQKLGNIKHGDKGEKAITVHTPDHTIDISVIKLTDHTSEVKIKANKYSPSVQKIINYTKMKEYSFLQY
jgi:MFS superfamily sulfate permease-like transporter